MWNISLPMMTKHRTHRRQETMKNIQNGTRASKTDKNSRTMEGIQSKDYSMRVAIRAEIPNCFEFHGRCHGGAASPHHHAILQSTRSFNVVECLAGWGKVCSGLLVEKVQSKFTLKRRDHYITRMLRFLFAAWVANIPVTSNNFCAAMIQLSMSSE